MTKIEDLASSFAELNRQIIRDISIRGFSHGSRDVETLSAIRENIVALKTLGVNLDVADEALPPGKAKKAGE